jgi:hypothetical protein
MDVNKLYKSVAILNALKSNVASVTSVDEKYVTEYRKVLQNLKDVGLDVIDFDVPNSEIQPRQTSFNYLSHESTYSDEKYVDKHYLLTKIDSVLNYLNLLLDKRPPELGFQKPS